ncbi:MAG: hypothetical protein QXU73_07555 [Thermoplasmata archaeon]
MMSKHHQSHKITCLITAFTLMNLLFIPANGSASNVGTEVSNATWELPPTSPLMNKILGLVNTSIYGRPIFADETTGAIYYSQAPIHLSLGVLYPNGSHEVLNDSLPGTAYTNWVYGMAKCGDGSLLLSIFADRNIYRSEDGGRTWTSVYNCQANTHAWRFAVRGNVVLTGEYGNPGAGKAARLLRSSDNGKSGTWSVVFETPQQTGSTANHWHVVYYDKYADCFYAAGGDQYFFCARSSNGVNWNYWGDFGRFTAITATAHNVYFGDDTPHRVAVYNKSTYDWGYHDMISPYTFGPVVSLYANSTTGVVYARAITEGNPVCIGGIYISPSSDGQEWYQVLNFTGSPSMTNGDTAWFDYHLLSDGHGRIVFGFTNPTPNAEDRGKVWIWRMRDLTRDEAYSLGSKVTTDFGLQYTPRKYGYDGESGYIELAEYAMANPTLVVTGNRVLNLAYNGSFPSPWISAWGSSGLAKGANAGETNNLTLRFDNQVYHSPPYSVRASGYNSTADHGKVRYFWALPSDKFIPPLTPFTFSVYVRIKVNELAPNSSTAFISRTAGTVYLTYTDTSSTGFGFISNLGYLQGQVSPANRAMYSDGGWTRCWFSNVTPAGKTVKWIMVDFQIIGKIDVWFDDIQLTLDEHLTPAMTGSGYQDKSSENITFSINHKTYHVGTLDEGQTVQISLEERYLAGCVPYHVEINGSRCLSWQLIGTKAASSVSCLVAYESEALICKHNYASGQLKVWKPIPLDGASFIGRTRIDTDPLLQIESASMVTVSFEEWSARQMRLKVVATDSVKFSLANLDGGVEYSVYVDGAFYATGYGPNLAFTYTGPWSEHTFEIRMSATELIMRDLFMPMIGVVLVLAVLSGLIGIVINGVPKRR